MLFRASQNYPEVSGLFALREGKLGTSFSKDEILTLVRVLGTVVGDPFPTQNGDSHTRNPTFYYIMVIPILETPTFYYMCTSVLAGMRLGSSQVA